MLWTALCGASHVLLAPVQHYRQQHMATLWHYSCWLGGARGWCVWRGADRRGYDLRGETVVHGAILLLAVGHLPQKPAFDAGS